MKRCIAAYTEHNYPGTNYPAYFSLNEEEDGRIVLSVRERGGDGNKVVHLELSEGEASILGPAILALNLPRLPAMREPDPAF